MSARRNSTRLAMAVSSILAAPAIVTGFGLAAGLAFAPEVCAQETSAQIAGIVLDAEGSAVAGAEVKVLHVPSGTSSSATTNRAASHRQAPRLIRHPAAIRAGSAPDRPSGRPRAPAEGHRLPVRRSVAIAACTYALQCWQSEQ